MLHFVSRLFLRLENFSFQAFDSELQVLLGLFQNAFESLELSVEDISHSVEFGIQHCLDVLHSGRELLELVGVESAADPGVRILAHVEFLIVSEDPIFF